MGSKDKSSVNFEKKFFAWWRSFVVKYSYKDDFSNSEVLENLRSSSESFRLDFYDLCARLALVLYLPKEERMKFGKFVRTVTIRECKEQIALLEKLKSKDMLIKEFKLSKKQLDEKIEDIKQELNVATRSRTRTHSGIKTPVEMLLIRLFILEFKYSMAVNMLYDLFVEFEYEDYGKGSEDDIKVEDVPTLVEEQQKDRIRKTFVDPLMREKNNFFLAQSRKVSS